VTVLILKAIIFLATHTSRFQLRKHISDKLKSFLSKSCFKNNALKEEKLSNGALHESKEKIRYHKNYL
jgi:hypothetical protein